MYVVIRCFLRQLRTWNTPAAVTSRERLLLLYGGTAGADRFPLPRQRARRHFQYRRRANTTALHQLQGPITVGMCGERPAARGDTGYRRV